MEVFASWKVGGLKLVEFVQVNLVEFVQVNSVEFVQVNVAASRMMKQ